MKTLLSALGVLCALSAFAKIELATPFNDKKPHPLWKLCLQMGIANVVVTIAKDEQ